MKQGISLQKDQVANIYQNMLEGDCDALYKLQNINHNYQTRFAQHQSPYLKLKNNTEQKTQKQSVQNQEDIQQKGSHHLSVKKQLKPPQIFGAQSKLQANLNKLKQKMYLNILKKGPKLQTILKNQSRQHYLGQRKWTNSSNNNYQNNPKTNSHQGINKQKQTKTQFSVEIKPNGSTNLPSNKNNKLYAILKSAKPSELPKVQSANIEQPKIIFHDIQKQQVRYKSKKNEKVDFRQIIGRSKKQKAELQQKNQQELDFQLKFVEFHKETKQKIQFIRNKYQLNFNNRSKYLKKKTNYQLSQQLIQGESTQKLSPFKIKYETEKAKCQEHYSDINQLKQQYSSNLRLLSKMEASINNNPFDKYYRSHSDQIYEEDEDEQEDIVQQLQTNQQKNNKYTRLMAHTRDKKWGLLQRTGYESQRAEQLYQSRKTDINSRVTVGGQENLHYITQKQNKVTVNERLKILLFN